MGTFAADISEFARRTKLKGATVVKKIAFDGLRGVMKKSPVDTGRFRASWRVGINTPDLSTAPKLKAGSSDDSGRLRDDKGKFVSGFGAGSGNQVINRANWGDTIFITNNLPYGPRLENGWSKQAPQGMLKLTFLELRTSLARAVASVRPV
jgi:hypothetical protein